jgi:hypothetical protein
MAISADPVGMHNADMDKAMHTGVAAATGRGPVTPIAGARRAHRSRQDELARARSARRALRPREERFAHLKRMHD